MELFLYVTNLFLRSTTTYGSILTKTGIFSLRKTLFEFDGYLLRVELRLPNCTMANVSVVKNKKHKWAIDLVRPAQEQTKVVAPIGYSEARQSTDIAARDKDSNLVAKKCWDIALGPLKQFPMNLFLMYMAGNTISIFPIMMVGMMVWRPIQAFLSLKTTFKLLEGSPQVYIQTFVFFVSNLLGIALALYKCSTMGLLPIYSSDWLSFLEPQERMEFSGGGMNF